MDFDKRVEREWGRRNGKNEWFKKRRIMLGGDVRGEQEAAGRRNEKFEVEKMRKKIDR
jgi:hypothetical protein